MFEEKTVMMPGGIEVVVSKTGGYYDLSLKKKNQTRNNQLFIMTWNEDPEVITRQANMLFSMKNYSQQLSDLCDELNKLGVTFAGRWGHKYLGAESMLTIIFGFSMFVSITVTDSDNNLINNWTDVHLRDVLDIVKKEHAKEKLGFYGYKE